MIKKALSFACLMLLTPCTEAVARCSVPYIPTFENQTVNGQMTVSSGAQCRIKLKRSRGPT
jgi:hypothetical protein